MDLKMVEKKEDFLMKEEDLEENDEMIEIEEGKII